MVGLDKLGETSFWGGLSRINDGFAEGSSGVSGTTIVFDNNPTTKLGAVPANGLISCFRLSRRVGPRQLSGRRFRSGSLDTGRGPRAREIRHASLRRLSTLQRRHQSDRSKPQSRPGAARRFRPLLYRRAHLLLGGTTRKGGFSPISAALTRDICRLERQRARRSCLGSAAVPTVADRQQITAKTRLSQGCHQSVMAPPIERDCSTGQPTGTHSTA